jgi:hypothetical protein
VREVFHQAICRYELDDIVNLKDMEDARYKIEEICLIQMVRKNTMEFRFALRNVNTGEMILDWVTADLMGEIIKDEQ